MRSKNVALLLLVVCVSLFAGWVFYDKIEQFVSAPERVSIQPQLDTPDLTAEGRSQRLPMPPRHPVPPLSKTAIPAELKPISPIALPNSLDQADAYLTERLPQMIADRKLLPLVNLNYFIQKLVLFIDHLPHKNLPRLYLPLTPPEPGFVTAVRGEEIVIDPRNATRYLPYVLLVEAIPDEPLLQLYRGLYPLFQQAYREISDPNAHFNDRLILVIDNLLETPEPSEPILVIHHVSRFKYADTSLEERSAGQKILLRMGVENTRRVKEKLRRIRLKLVRQDW